MTRSADSVRGGLNLTAHPPFPLFRDLGFALSGGGRTRSVLRAVPVSGGCINAAYRLDLDDGERIFLKTNATAPPGMFRAEADGLRALRSTGAIRVPEPLAAGEIEGIAFLALEFLEPSRPSPRYWESFGRSLAALHRASAPRFGFAADNWIGATPQPNGWTDSWLEFFRVRRLGAQLEGLSQKGLVDRETRRRFETVADRLDRWIDEDRVRPALVHGDLWSGNAIVASDGAPALVDPAAHYADREVDIAMTRLFGGFDARFLDAYREAWPLESGWEERIDLYNLYHMANHLNLFGASYLGGVASILRRYS